MEHSLGLPGRRLRYAAALICWTLAGVFVAGMWPCLAQPTDTADSQSALMQRMVLVNVLGSAFPNVAVPEDGHVPTLCTLPQSGTRQGNIEAHLKRMHEAGFDGVLLTLDVQSAWKSGQPPVDVLRQGDLANTWAQVMARDTPKMRLAVCLRYDAGASPSADARTAAIDFLLATLGHSPVVLTVGKRPVVFLEMGTHRSDMEAWAEVRDRLKQRVFLVATIIEGPSADGVGSGLSFNEPSMRFASRTFDGLAVIPEGAPLAWIESFCPRLSIINQAAGKPFCWGISPGFYSVGDAFVEPQFEYLASTWALARDSKDSWVILNSWNGSNSSSEIWPSADRGDVLIEIQKFYATWFHSGKMPEVEMDRVYVNYPVSGTGMRTTHEGDSPTYPRLGYWILLRKAARLEFAGLGSVDLKKGLNMGHLGPVRPGLPSEFRLIRDGKTIDAGKLPSPMTDAGGAEDLSYRWVDVGKL